MKRSWQTFRLMHISLQVSELPDRLLSIIRNPKGERFISKVKYQPSAKKMVKPKQVITFVLLLERSDGFLLCDEDAQRSEDRASGFFWEHAHKENSEDYLLSAHLSTPHHKVFFSFLFIILQSPLQNYIFFPTPPNKLPKNQQISAISCRECQRQYCRYRRIRVHPCPPWK